MAFNIAEWGALLLALVFFALLYYLDKFKQVDFGFLVLLATALGIGLGVAFKGHYSYYYAVGRVYTSLISALVIPLLGFSIVSSITNLGASIRLKSIGLKTVFFLLLNTLIASVITLFVAIVTNVGQGFSYELATDYQAAEILTIIDTLVSLFPQNIVGHWSSGEVVPTVVFLILVYVFLVVLAVLVAVGSVGVPGTATITATALFTAAGLPVEVIVLLSPISSIVDMARTATNVVGAAAATTLVAATEEGQLNFEAYQTVGKESHAVQAETV